MVENKENRVPSPTVCANENRSEKTKKTEENETVLLQSGNRKKGASQKRCKMSNGANEEVDIAELKDQSIKTEKQCADEMLFDRMESLDVCESDQGAPVSFKSFFKAVKSFSRRKPKIPKMRDEVVREKRETDVIVFERFASPRSFCKSRRTSRSLPPIMDIHDLLSAEIQATEESGYKDLDCLRSDDKLQATNIKEAQGTVTSSEKTSIQPHATAKKEVRRHRCSGFLQELEPDALQEFGSFDVSMGMGNRDHDRRITRKSLGYLRNTTDDQEALHF